MKKFNVDDTVAMIKDGEIVEGVVTRVVDLVTPPILVVDFDGSVEKVHSTTVVLVQRAETKSEESEEKVESEDKPKSPTVIKCTSARFLEALKKVTDSDVIFADDHESGQFAYHKGMCALAVGVKIKVALFGEKDEIELDKYILLWEIVNEITPTKLAEKGGVGTAGDFNPLAGALTDIFMNLITELFGAEND